MVYVWYCPDCGERVFTDILKKKGDYLQACGGTGIHYHSSSLPSSDKTGEET